MIVIVIGGIIRGIFTATEGAVVAVVYSLVLSLYFYRSITWKDLPEIFMDSAQMAGIIIFLIGVSSIMSWVMAFTGLPAAISGAMLGISNNPYVILLIINLMLLVIGMFMDTGPALLIFAPMLLPLTNALNVDPIHLGIIMTVNMAIGFISPPFGVTLFTASPMVKETPWDIGVTSLPFILADIVALLVITFVPWFSLTLVY